MSTQAFNPRRRILLSAAGGLLVTATLVRRASAADEVEIAMSGTPNGSQVWFRPRGLLVQPGQTIRWVNRDTGNAHTATAYHPDNGKPLRMPKAAKPWNSDYLLPKESFAVTFTVPGIYDYFCIPHEHAGMVGRIVVGNVKASNSPYAGTDSKLPAVAVANFPNVAAILKETKVK